MQMRTDTQFIHRFFNKDMLQSKHFDPFLLNLAEAGAQQSTPQFTSFASVSKNLRKRSDACICFLNEEVSRNAEHQKYLAFQNIKPSYQGYIP